MPTVMLVPVYDRPVDRRKIPNRVEYDSIEAIRNMVAWMLSHGIEHASVEQHASRAFRMYVRMMEDQYNQGAPFPQRTGDLKDGRRPGVHGKNPTVPIAGEWNGQAEEPDQVVDLDSRPPPKELSSGEE